MARHTELPTDVGGVNVKPTITIEDVDKTAKQEDAQKDKQVAKPNGRAQEEDTQELGAYPEKKAPEVPKRLYFGFSHHGGDTGGLTTDQVRTRTLLEEYASEAWYGTSFHK
jgi:hypothetical protein